MKRAFGSFICILIVLTAGCGSNQNTKESNKDSGVHFTTEQVAEIKVACDTSDDSEIFIKNTFTDYHCYYE